jgi:hypothetical protein
LNRGGESICSILNSDNPYDTFRLSEAPTLQAA